MMCGTSPIRASVWGMKEHNLHIYVAQRVLALFDYTIWMDMASPFHVRSREVTELDIVFMTDPQDVLDHLYLGLADDQFDHNVV